MSKNSSGGAMENLTIRKLTSSDADDIAALWLTCTREVSIADPIYTPAVAHHELCELLSRELQTGARFGWAAFEGWSLVAYVTCRIEQESELFIPRQFIYLIDLDVAPAFRGRGLARSLLAEVEQFAQSKDIDRLELAYVAADTRARAVWERLGFRPHFIYMHRCISVPR